MADSNVAWQDQYEAACREARAYIWRLADQQQVAPIVCADGVLMVIAPKNSRKQSPENSAEN